jgi:hypothetical protein
MSGRSISGVTRAVGRNSLDLPLAALAALAAAFIAFTLPADQLSRLVGSTGLPSVLSAAQPPLGMTARLGLGATGAVAIFALVYLGLRLLDRQPKRKARNDALLVPVEEAPRLRRRDFHPDAPARRPISASRDLGEPDLANDEPASPLWLAPAEPEDSIVDQAEETEPKPEESEEPAVWPEAVVDCPDPGIPSTAECAASAKSSTTSIQELMARLEEGLARRRPAEPVADEAKLKVQVDPVAPAEAQDDRLQNAIESLQRLASRQA